MQAALHTRSWLNNLMSVSYLSSFGSSTLGFWLTQMTPNDQRDVTRL